jgi:hypothetical protein
MAKFRTVLLIPIQQALDPVRSTRSLMDKFKTMVVSLRSTTAKSKPLLPSLLLPTLQFLDLHQPALNVKLLAQIYLIQPLHQLGLRLNLLSPILLRRDQYLHQVTLKVKHLTLLLLARRQLLLD